MTNPDIIMPTPSADTLPVVRSLQLTDLKDVLKKGKNDFWAMPTHVVFLSLIYPIAGLILAGITFDFDSIRLLYPLAAGFVLIGPLAAIGLYELSRRRELGLDTSWRHAFDVFHSPSLPAIVALGLLLLALFLVWIACAEGLYYATFGYRRIASASEFLRLVLSTPEGHNLIIFGNAIGFLFAVLAATVSVVSFPILLDRNIGFSAAILTSVIVVIRNPMVMAAWGLIVAGALALGTLLMFVGLAVIIPILGHATWHLYRKAVEPDPNPRPEYHPGSKAKRYAADFPASLFSNSRQNPTED